jgi:hypothetical protein
MSALGLEDGYRSLVRYQKMEEGPMLIRSSFISAVALAGALSIGFTPSVEALTMKECSAKFQAESQDTP